MESSFGDVRIQFGVKVGAKDTYEIGVSIKKWLSLVTQMKPNMAEEDISIGISCDTLPTRYQEVFGCKFSDGWDNKQFNIIVILVWASVDRSTTATLSFSFPCHNS